MSNHEAEGLHEGRFIDLELLREYMFSPENPKELVIIIEELPKSSRTIEEYKSDRRSDGLDIELALLGLREEGEMIDYQTDTGLVILKDPTWRAVEELSIRQDIRAMFPPKNPIAPKNLK